MLLGAVTAVVLTHHSSPFGRRQNTAVFTSSTGSGGGGTDVAVSVGVAVWVGVAEAVAVAVAVAVTVGGVGGAGVQVGLGLGVPLSGAGASSVTQLFTSVGRMGISVVAVGVCKVGGTAVVVANVVASDDDVTTGPTVASADVAGEVGSGVGVSGAVAGVAGAFTSTVRYSLMSCPTGKFGNSAVKVCPSWVNSGL